MLALLGRLFLRGGFGLLGTRLDPLAFLEHLQTHRGRHHLRIDVDQHPHGVAVLEAAHGLALLVQEVERHFARQGDPEDRGVAADAGLLDRTQRLKRAALGGADHAEAGAMGANLAREFLQARAKSLARQLEQPELADLAHLDPGTVGLEGLAQALLHRALMAALGHVDEVDDDEPGQIAQAELPGHLVGGLEVGLDRGLVDVALARRAAGVDVDRGEGFGRVDDDRAAGRELDHGAVHRVELVLDAVAEEERFLVLVELHQARAARHEHRHQPLGRAIALLALDQHFLDVSRVEVAHGALDKVAFFVDQLGRNALQRGLANLVPQAQQILVVALDLALVALLPGGADDQPHAGGNLELVRDLLELAAVLGLHDLAADAAAARRVGHEHAVAAGEREIGGERSPLVAALLLDDLHQHDLPAFDHLLDLVAAQEARPASCLLGDDLRGLLVGIVRDRLGSGFAFRFAVHTRRLGRGLALVLLEQGTIGLRNLVVVGMDLAERKEAMAVAAIVDERRLERRLDPRHLGKIDVALELELGGSLEIEIGEMPVIEHDRPGFLRVVRVDQHAFDHGQETPIAAAPAAASAPGSGGSMWERPAALEASRR